MWSRIYHNYQAQTSGFLSFQIKRCVTNGNSYSAIVIGLEMKPYLIPYFETMELLAVAPFALCLYFPLEHFTFYGLSIPERYEIWFMELPISPFLKYIPPHINPRDTFNSPVYLATIRFSVLNYPYKLTGYLFQVYFPGQLLWWTIGGNKLWIKEIEV